MEQYFKSFFIIVSNNNYSINSNAFGMINAYERNQWISNNVLLVAELSGY
jgi:hypothetical protein